MDAVKQNRITRKRLRKQVKRQAQKRVNSERENGEKIANLTLQLTQVMKKNADCEQLLIIAVDKILDCVNNAEFLPNAYIQFDLGFMRMSYSDAAGFSLLGLRLPDVDDFDNKKGA